jgi:uncharacterized membrane protein YraQ (UPF0718 family)
MHSSIWLYGITIVLLLISFFTDKKKTVQALQKGWKSLSNIAPEFIAVILLVGILLSIISPSTISTLIGSNSGFFGVLVATTVGSITLIPGMIAFPTAAIVLGQGAGYTQIAAFVSSLMMVGVVTLPIEIKYFGKKIAFTRNAFALLFTFLVAYVIGWVMSL